MIVKHSSDETPKPMPVGLRLARVISIGNGTVDVCPVGSSVVLHDIPVTSATTMQVGDVINLQMMDNKRFAFAQQNVASVSESVEKTVTIVSPAAESGGGGGGSTGTLSVGSGLSVSPSSAGNLGGNVSLSLDSSVARNTWQVVAGSGLTGGGALSSSGITLNVGAGNGIEVLAESVAVKRATTSGLSFDAGGGLQIDDAIAGAGLGISSKVLAVNAGNGISVSEDAVAVNQAYSFVWSAQHAFNSGFNAAASTFTGLLTGTSGTFSGDVSVGTTSGGLNVGTTGAGAGNIRASGNLGVNGGGVSSAAVEAWGAVNALPSATGTAAEAAFRASGAGTNAILDIGTSGATGVAWLQARNRTNYATNYSVLINPNGGNVGINRVNPSYPLDVTGNVRFTGGLNVGTTGAGTGEIVALSNISGASGTFTGGLNVGSASGAAAGEVRTSSSASPRVVIESTGSGGNSRSYLRFSGTEASEFMSIGYYPDASPRRMHINYNGESVSLPIMSLTSTNRVGINMQTPSYTLDVSGDVRASGSVNVGTAAGTTAGYLYTSGRIGVGKNAADYPLDVVGDIYSSASVRANTSVITQELTGAGASTSVSLTNGTGFRSSQYVSGFAGNGWRIYRQDNSTKAEWEVDNLTVRGTLSVYELLIQQIRATNGSIFVSAAAKIESVTGTGPYTLTVEGGSSDYAPFAVGDVIRAQRVSLGTSTLVWQSDLTVTHTNVGGNLRAFTATLRSGSTAPAEGMEYVRLGNTTDASRQGAVYLTADDSGAPFIDIVDGITSHADWGAAGKVKSRIGRLNGILGGATANYGIWSGTGTANTDSWVKMAEDGILLNNVPLRMYSGGNQTVDFAASGNLKIGTNVANASTTALNWDGATLSIKGNITVTGGDAETTSGAQSKANAARDTAQTYSDAELGKIVGKTNGKLAFAVAAAPTAGSGLYLGSTYLGYYSGGWKTYMNSTGQFYLSGTGNQGLSWDGATLSIDGDLTARSGSFEGYVTIGTAGGLYQGTGTGASPTSGLRIRNNNGLGSVELWASSVVRGVFGNLRSLYDYGASDLYGVAIGPYSNSTSHITVEPSNGIRMRNRASDGTVYQVFRVDNSGAMTVGRADLEYISINTTDGIRMLDGTSTKFQVNASGEVYIGDTSGSNNNVQITSTELNIRRGTQKMLSLTGTSMTINNSNGNPVITLDASGNSQFTGVMTIGTSGEIRQGTGSLTALPATYTGLRIWAETSGGNLFGRIAGYNSGTVQWEARNDGRLYAGGGNTKIDSSGITISASSIYDTTPNGLKWSKPFIDDSRQIHVYTSAAAGGGENATLYIENINSDKGGAIQIQAEAGAGQTTYGAGITLRAQRSTDFSQLHIRQDAAFLTGGGLNVGSATGATTGQVRAHELYLGTGSDVRLYRSTADMLRTPDSATIDGGLNVGSATGAGTGEIKASSGITATTASLSSTLAVTGASTLTGALSVDGELGHSTSSTWINTGISFNTNWSNFGADETTWSFARYKRVGDLVFLRGMIKRAAATGLSTSPFTLPAGFRPAKRQICTVFGLRNASTAIALRADVLISGVVQFDIDTTSAYDYISLNGIVFSVT